MKAWMAAGAVALALGAGAGAYAAAGPAHFGRAPDADRGSLGATEDAPSLYSLHLTLRGEDQGTMGVDVFRGHPTLVAMFYGSCPSACPVLISSVARLDAQLPAAVRAETRVLLVSFDAEHDTPEALARIAERHRVDARWKFAAGADDEVRQLANALGVVYRKESGGAFSHNSVIAALDGEGRVVARVDDPRADLAPLVKAINASR